MAKNLNKSRMRDTKILMALTILVGIFCSSMFREDNIGHEAFELAGYILVTVCAIGRVYSTAFIGGIKNDGLVTVGPYSMVRNPLYFFSLLGAAGIGLMSTHILAFVVIFFGFLLIYRSLIKREEEFLLTKFGKEYEDYQQRVPRLWPSMKNYTCPEELTFQPKYLTKAVFDAVWWFAPYILFELSDVLIETGVIKPLFTIF